MPPIHHFDRITKSIAKPLKQFVSNYFHISSNNILHRNPFFVKTRCAFDQASPQETEFCVKAPNPDSNATSKDAEKVCSLLSTCPNTSISSILTQSKIIVSPELVEEVLKRLTNAGMLAFGFFKWAEKNQDFKYTTQSFHYLIEALGKIKQFRLIWDLIDSMKRKGLLRKDTFGLVIRRYARARKIREAIASFEKMESYGLKPDITDYNSLVDTITKAKNVERAQMIVNDMKRKKVLLPDIKTYSILLEGWGQERNLGKVKEIFREIVEEGFTPDVVTYGILINCFCKLEKLDEAMEILGEMDVRGLKASPHIYCTLINGFGSSKRLNDALKYFNLSKTSGLAPELPTYNAVVGAYCWVLQFEDAFRTVDEMKKNGIEPNARTYDIIIHHLIKAGKKDEAYRIFQSMGKEGKCEPQLNTYTMMVSMFCSGERVDLALKVWNEMSLKGVLPCMHMFSALINGLIVENRLDDACKYFKEMLGKGIRPPGQLFSNLKSALIDGGKRDLALELGVKLDSLRKTPLSG